VLKINKLKMLCASLLLSAGLGCSTTVPDVEVCATVSTGGFCKTTVSELERDIPASYWQSCYPTGDMPCLPKMLHVSPKDIGKILKFIETVCEKHQNCVAEDVKQAKLFLANMESRIAN
jgi:hypothetical protein